MSRDEMEEESQHIDCSEPEGWKNLGFCEYIKVAEIMIRLPLGLSRLTFYTQAFNVLNNLSHW